MLEVRLFSDVVTNGGESPLWDVQSQRLLWLDNAAGLVFRSTEIGTEIAVWRVPRLITALAVRAGGGLVVTSGRRVLGFDLETNQIEDLVVADDRPSGVFNDGKVDRSGRFVTGTVDAAAFDERGLVTMPDEPAGLLYCLADDLALRPLTGGIGITNGPCFSCDGTTLYCSDSAAGSVYTFDYGDGVATNRRVLAQFDEDGVVPDGATVDEEGGIWVAAFGAGEIRRFAPDGAMVDRVPVPVDHPTSVMFGGQNLDVLFVTSQGRRHGDGTKAPSPIAGRVLAVHGLGVRGVPERRFDG